MRKSTPAMNFKTSTLECDHCGVKEKIELPMSLGAVGHKMKKFAHVHSKCKDSAEKTGGKP